MRKVLFNLHLYVALAAGALIVIFGVTGSILAFEPELDRLFHWKLSSVTPAPHTLTLAEITQAVHKVYPSERITAFAIATSPDLSYQVNTDKRSVYINQYTGEVLGTREFGLDFLGFVHQLHLRLGFHNKADTGGTIMAWAAVGMLYLLLSGLYLWWPLKRFRIQRGKSSRRFWFDVHNAVGIFAFAVLLCLTLTGLSIGFENYSRPWYYRITNSEATKTPVAPSAPAGSVAISPDRALDIARAALPGAAPFQFGIPGPKGMYLIRSRFPEDLTPGGRSRVFIDQYTGQVLQVESSRTGPGGTRIVNYIRAIHTGDILGLSSKFLMSLTCLFLVLQVVSGILIWWKRIRANRLASRRTAQAMAK